MSRRIHLNAMLIKVLSDNKPLSAKEVVKVSGVDKKHVWDGLYYWWKRGLLLRAEKPTFENQENFKGRRGLTRNTRSYYLYMLKPEGEDSVLISGQKFVSFKKKYLDLRGSRGASKAQAIFDFLRTNSDKVFFPLMSQKIWRKKVSLYVTS